ncbi:protein of unknown function (DUF397) [Parafrankia irregularis]|uniref:DUF397 domain-containing protein n=1 Tax=Parafrankia irregularis TaxID=795642 RepID=A0A0S4QYR0_9ACTN|nr:MULTISPECIES: DUF397 domain-containing protein [Parafrankia]MBE3206656.1 DUF397 domain-containing protein [Parafrankia sp. CH37]CUU60785.1 protein of unknown function (DUF397) [Parafrankia irregularis]
MTSAEPGPVWIKSSHSNSSGGNCVEVRLGVTVSVRDSKDPSGPILTFTSQGWDAFLRGAVDGEFDLPREV